MKIYKWVSKSAQYVCYHLFTGPHLLPRESTLMIPAYLVHRNERIYPNPEIYDPDRFLPENVSNNCNKFRICSTLFRLLEDIPMITFRFLQDLEIVLVSAHSWIERCLSCVGQRFAMNQLKIVISWLLRRYKFHSDRYLI